MVAPVLSGRCISASPISRNGANHATILPRVARPHTAPAVAAPQGDGARSQRREIQTASVVKNARVGSSRINPTRVSSSGLSPTRRAATALRVVEAPAMRHSMKQEEAVNPSMMDWNTAAEATEDVPVA